MKVYLNASPWKGYVHLYGKKITKPFRKMGHVTIVDSDAAKAREKANFVKDNLKIKA